MSSDELKVPSQRTEDADEHSDSSDERSHSADERSHSADEPGRFAHDDEPGERPYGDEPGERRYNDESGEPPRGDLTDDEFARGDAATAPAGEHANDEDDEERRAESPRAGDEYAAAVPGAVVTPAPGAVVTPVPGAVAGDDEAAYRDPYARTGGDMLTEPEHGPDPVHTSAVSDETPAHAAPDDVTLFDQDPAQVQARWRDLQASFVDDPGEAVQRADGLVGEVVESLTSSLTSRTNALRDRWKDTATPDTEQLRLALRDYRTVLERLLALSSHQSTQPSGHQSQETR
ncbi:hypothetical protein [Nonomuraea sp. NPDC049480]|uniref:hypothetical protein n=1 Tax=Nonomuraea sp. NPDC049480 TaxID=3364353 RepID=UPI0037A7DCA7